MNDHTGSKDCSVLPKLLLVACRDERISAEPEGILVLDPMAREAADICRLRKKNVRRYPDDIDISRFDGCHNPLLLLVFSEELGVNGDEKVDESKLSIFRSSCPFSCFLLSLQGTLGASVNRYQTESCLQNSRHGPIAQICLCRQNYIIRSWVSEAQLTSLSKHIVDLVFRDTLVRNGDSGQSLRVVANSKNTDNGCTAEASRVPFMIHGLGADT